MDEALEVRRFWFGKLPLKPDGVSERMALWFGTAAEEQQADELVRSRFGPLIERAAAGELGAWADSPRRRLSLILLLDQFPRHAYRGTGRAFATDREALALTLSGMQSAADAALSPRGEDLFLHAAAARGTARCAGRVRGGLPPAGQRSAGGARRDVHAARSRRRSSMAPSWRASAASPIAIARSGAPTRPRKRRTSPRWR